MPNGAELLEYELGEEDATVLNLDGVLLPLKYE